MLFGGNVLCFRVAEGQNLVALDPLAGEVAEYVVLVLGTRCTEVHEEFGDRVLGCAADPLDGAETHSFDETTDDLRPFFFSQPVYRVAPQAC